MKVYSWFTLFVTVFGGGGYLVYEIIKMQQDPFVHGVQCAFMIYLIGRGLFASLSKEGYEKDKKMAVRGKRVRKKLFGHFALIVPTIPLLLLCLAFLSITFLPDQSWLCWLLLILGMISAIGIGIVFKKHMKIEEDLEQQEQEKQFAEK